MTNTINLNKHLKLGKDLIKWDKYTNNLSQTKFYKRLITLLREGNKVNKFYPKVDNIFLPFDLCSPEDLKVVIITDTEFIHSGIPYGCSYRDKQNLIYEDNKVLSKLEESFEVQLGRELNLNFDPTLESWAIQGVLMLNSSLIYNKNKTDTYQKVWRKFNAHILKQLSINMTGIHYIFMGCSTGYYKKYINHKTNYIYDTNKPESSCIFSVQPFIDINKKILLQNGEDEMIDWINMQ